MPDCNVVRDGMDDEATRPWNMPPALWDFPRRADEKEGLLAPPAEVVFRRNLSLAISPTCTERQQAVVMLCYAQRGRCYVM